MEKVSGMQVGLMKIQKLVAYRGES